MFGGVWWSTTIGFFGGGPSGNHTRSDSEPELISFSSLPDCWQTSINQIGHVRIALSEESDEFKEIAKFIPSPWVAKKIERVENVELYLRYQREKARVQKNCPTLRVDRMLFHGTLAANINSICENGFEKKRIGQSTKNRGHFGSGVYFSPNFATSHRYSRRDNTVLYCNVLVGESVVGKCCMPKPPYKPHQKRVRFETAVDSLADPNEIVSFVDSRSYPAYILHYV